MPILKFAAIIDPYVNITTGVVLNAASSLSGDVDIDLSVSVSDLNSLSSLSFTGVSIDGIPVYVEADPLNSSSMVEFEYHGPIEIIPDSLNSTSDISFGSVVALTIIKSFSRVVSTYADFVVHYPPTGYGSVECAEFSVVGHCGGQGNVEALEDIDAEVESTAIVSDVGICSIVISTIEVVSNCGGSGSVVLPYSQILVNGSAHADIISYGDIVFGFSASGTGKQESVGSASVSITINVHGSGLINARSYASVLIQLIHISGIGIIGAVGDSDIDIEGYPDSMCISGSGNQESAADGVIEISDELYIDAMSYKSYEVLRYPWET